MKIEDFAQVKALHARLGTISQHLEWAEKSNVIEMRECRLSVDVNRDSDRWINCDKPVFAAIQSLVRGALNAEADRVKAQLRTLGVEIDA